MVLHTLYVMNWWERGLVSFQLDSDNLTDKYQLQPISSFPPFSFPWQEKGMASSWFATGRVDRTTVNISVTSEQLCHVQEIN